MFRSIYWFFFSPLRFQPIINHGHANGNEWLIREWSGLVTAGCVWFRCRNAHGCCSAVLKIYIDLYSALLTFGSFHRLRDALTSLPTVFRALKMHSLTLVLIWRQIAATFWDMYHGNWGFSWHKFHHGLRYRPSYFEMCVRDTVSGVLAARTTLMIVKSLPYVIISLTIINFWMIHSHGGPYKYNYWLL